MILIPELETVVILVPRTGTRSLKRAISTRWPKAIHLYRHMEADGVPIGYDRWSKIGIVREPVERLWSLYKFCRTDVGLRSEYPDYAARQAAATAKPFDEWLTGNSLVFTDPYDCRGGLGFYPQFNVLHSLPENRKSQFLYLRPDLGTTIWRFDTEFDAFCDRLNLSDVPFTHSTKDGGAPPRLDASARNHVERFFAWDIAQCGAA